MNYESIFILWEIAYASELNEATSSAKQGHVCEIDRRYERYLAFSTGNYPIVRPAAGSQLPELIWLSRISRRTSCQS